MISEVLQNEDVRMDEQPPNLHSFIHTSIFDIRYSVFNIQKDRTADASPVLLQIARIGCNPGMNQAVISVRRSVKKTWLMSDFLPNAELAKK